MLKIYVRLDFFRFAFFVLAFAAALEAFVAIRRRSSAVILCRRAFPPFRPISERYLEMEESFILGTIAPPKQPRLKTIETTAKVKLLTHLSRLDRLKQNVPSEDGNLREG